MNAGPIGIGLHLVLIPEVPSLDIEIGPAITVVLNLTPVHKSNDVDDRRMNDVEPGNVLGLKTDCIPRGELFISALPAV